MVAPDVAERIRAIFLHHEHRVTPDAAAKMLSWTRAQMNDAIDAEEINVVGMCSGKTMIEIRELASYVSYEWPIRHRESSRPRGGADSPAGVANAEAHRSPPADPHSAAGGSGQRSPSSPSKFLELEIEERAGNEKERLAGIIPGIVEAYYWPHEVPNQRVF